MPPAQEGLLAIAYLFMISIIAFIFSKIRLTFKIEYPILIFTMLYCILTLIMLYAIIKSMKKDLNFIGFNSNRLTYIVTLSAIIIVSCIIVIASNNIKRNILILIIVFVLIFTEELVFRGFSYPILRKATNNKTIAYLTCSIFMSIIAIFISTNNVDIHLMTIVNYLGACFLVQFFFQEIYSLSKNIIYSIAIHYLLSVSILIFTNSL